MDHAEMRRIVYYGYNLPLDVQRELVEQVTGSPLPPPLRRCLSCQAAGYVNGLICHRCNGSGYTGGPAVEAQ